MFKEKSGQPFELFANSRYRNHFVYLALFIMYLPMAWLGFHPHHEGLMLATLNLTADALAQNLPIPFNQYGYLWMLPFLPFNFLPLNGYTFLAQRLTSIILIFISSFLIYKISRYFFSEKFSIFISIFFLSTYSYGQPSLLWPSIPGQTSLLLLTYSILRFLQNNHQAYLFVASFSSFILIGSRIQIGIAAVFATFALLRVAKLNKKSWSYLIYVSALLLLYVFLLSTKGYLNYAFFDSLIYPFEYLDRSQANWTFPRTSIVIFIVLLLLLLLLTKSDKQNRLLAILAYSNAFLAIVLLLTFYTNPQLFHKLYSRTYVAVLFLFIFLLVSSLLSTFSKSKLHTFQEKSLFIYGAIGSIQLFPNFDAFHGWYASAPLIITFPLILKKNQIFQKLTASIVFKFLQFNLSFLVTLFSIQSINAYMSDSQPFPLEQVKGIRLSNSQFDDFQNEFDFFKVNIPRHSKVLNLCPNADPFFERGYWTNATRFLVFWPPLEKPFFKDPAILESEFIVSCIDVENLGTEATQLLSRNFQLMETVAFLGSWGLDWKIYYKIK